MSVREEQISPREGGLVFSERRGQVKLGEGRKKVRSHPKSTTPRRKVSNEE